MTSTEAVKALRTEVSELGDNIKGWRSDLDESDRIRRRQLVVSVVALALLAVFVAAAITLAVLNRQLNARVHDCIDPGGTCYRQSQERTAGVVTAITEREKAIAVAVAVCDRTTDTTEALVECVDAALANPKETP